MTDVLCQPLSSASVLVESASAVSSKSAILNQAPFTLREYVHCRWQLSNNEKCHTNFKTAEKKHATKHTSFKNLELRPLHTESEIFACVFPFFRMQRMRKRRKSNLIQIFFFFDGRKFRRQCASVIDTTWGRIYFLTWENFGLIEQRPLVF